MCRIDLHTSYTSTHCTHSTRQNTLHCVPVLINIQQLIICSCRPACRKIEARCIALYPHVAASGLPPMQRYPCLWARGLALLFGHAHHVHDDVLLESQNLSKNGMNMDRNGLLVTWIPMTMTLLWNWGNAWKYNNLKAVYSYPVVTGIDVHLQVPDAMAPSTWDDHLQVVKRIHGEDGAQERLAPSSKRFVGLPQQVAFKVSKWKYRHRLVETIHFPYKVSSLKVRCLAALPHLSLAELGTCILSIQEAPKSHHRAAILLLLWISMLCSAVA